MLNLHGPDDQNQQPGPSRRTAALDLKNEAAEPAQTTATQMVGTGVDQGGKAAASARPVRPTRAAFGLLSLAWQVGLWGTIAGILNIILALVTERLLVALASHQRADQHQTLLLAFFSISLLLGLSPPFLAGHLATRRQGNARLGSLAGAWSSLIVTLLLAALKVYKPISADQEIASHSDALLLLQLAVGLECRSS